MCGINGIFIKDRASEYLAKIQRMNDVIRHRGPDDDGVYRDQHVLLGHRRLSIIDLSPHASQPMSNEDKTLWVVFNGEIYNFRQLRDELEGQGHRFHSRSDTEVLLHGYEEWGGALFERLDGMFAFGLWDTKTQELLLVRDGCGIKPLFYCFDGQRLVFSSEIKGLLTSGTIDRKIHPQALANYLSLFYVPSPDTIVSGVKQVVPGSYLRFTLHGDMRSVKFWDPQSRDTNRMLSYSEEELWDQLRTNITQTVNSSLISDVPVSLLLSGGLDSSIILHELKTLGRSDIETVTIGFKDDSYDERHVAQRFSSDLDFQNTNFLVHDSDVPQLLEKIVYHVDALNANPNLFAVYSCYEKAAQKGKVTLTGSGNDELFAGYATYKADRYRRYYGLLPRWSRKLGVSLAACLPVNERQYSFDYLAKKFTEGALFPKEKSHYWWRTIFIDEEKQALFKKDFVGDQQIELDAFHTFAPYYRQTAGKMSFEEQNLYTDFHLFLIDNDNIKADQLSMAFSLESRPSFLTKQFVEFAFAFPYHAKLRGKHTKYCLRKSYEGRLPDYLLRRKKQGLLSPLGFLFQKEMKTFWYDYLLSDHLAEFFHIEYIEFLLDRQMKRLQDNSYKLFALLVFSIWKKHFMN
ncbi:MAG: asparagine synthase (glutamine-hydrolyzing) [bacterium]|nr:asparagine synthase (glutamine-hydrolyzing) [bacterium]